VPVAERKSRQRLERLEARVQPEVKALWQRAAKIQGRSLTDFVVSSAVENARRIVQENEAWNITVRDKMAFVEALLNSPVPNAKLRKAAERHTQLLGS
jgi:uncharacterized protein (DUF1778 family)